ncbi:MAG: phage major capsid protein [Candidatus Paceibacterota bacterium]|jgi:HK97 family phage major capsid protein
MFKLYKLIKSLMAQGFATAEQKAQVAALYKELEGEEKEAAKDEVEAANKLPETDPKATDDEKELEKNIKSLVKKAVKDETAEGFTKAVEGIKSEFKAWAEKQMEAMKKQAGNFHPDVQAKRKGFSSYLRKFATALVSNDAVALKELTTSAAGTPFGGYVVDGELSAEIRHLVTEYGVARREMMTVQLTKHSYEANALVTDVTVAWADEAAAIGSTQVVLGQESLELKKLAAIVTLTRELLEDEEIDLFAFIAARVAEGFARKEDAAFFTGEGSGDTANGEFTGLLFNADVTPVTIPVRGSLNGQSFTHMTADDLLAMQDAVPQAVASKGKYFMHRSVRSIVRRLKDNENQYIYQAPSENGPATIWGRPVVEVEVMPSSTDTAADTPFVIYGDLKVASILGYKGGISADRFNAGTVRNVAGNADINLITTDREAIRWVERVGAITILPSSVAVLSTASGS